MRAVSKTLAAIACGVGLPAVQGAHSQIYDSAALYAPGSGGEANRTALPGYSPVPVIWQYNPVAVGNPPQPMLKDQLTYHWKHANSPGLIELYVNVAATPLGTGEPSHYLRRTMDWLHAQDLPLHSVFADLEAGYLPNAHDDVRAVIAEVRAHPGAAINNAKIGNYDDFPGPYRYYYPWPEQYPQVEDNVLLRTTDGELDDEFYRSSGLQIAMPIAYPYSVAKMHAVPNYWNAGRWTDPATGTASTFSLTSPNERSAYFWAPLEAVSTALRHLTGSMASHEVVPFVSQLQKHPDYMPTPGQELTFDDLMASLIHYRLRGVTGFYAWSADVHQVVDGVSYTQYREAMRDTWRSLDAFFERLGGKQALNTGTTCIDGIEWSATQKGNRVLAILSNLSGNDRAHSWANDIPLYTDRTKRRNVRQLPPLSPTIPANVHRQLQYRTGLFRYDDMQSYVLGNPMNAQGRRSWQGLNAGTFVATVPPGSGNDSSIAVSSHPATPNSNQLAWVRMIDTGFAAGDQVVYSADLFGDDTIGFAPVTLQGLSAGAQPEDTRQGFFVYVHEGKIEFRLSTAGASIYRAVNVPDVSNQWLELQVLVDPLRDPDGAASGNYGAARLYVRNLSAGQSRPTQLVWDDTATQPTERSWELPLALDKALKQTHLFDAFMLVASGGSEAVDNLNMGYQVRTLDDGLEHYSANVSMNLQTLPWKGPDAMRWQATAPQGTGNTSSVAASPIASSLAQYAWWKTERTDLGRTELVGYSAKLYGCSGAGFAPANTTYTADGQKIRNGDTAFYASTFWGKFRLRATRDWGDVYEATNVTCAADKWYELQVQVDQLSSSARVYVRNLTDNGSPILLTFDNTNTSGAESTSTVPLQVGTTNTADLLEGWEVYGYDQYVQIDDLRSFLYPHLSFAVAEYVE